MDDYKETYYMLFNKISEIVEELQKVQREAEEMFVEQEAKIVEIRKKG